MKSFLKWANQDEAKVFEVFKTSKTGLSQADVKVLLAKHGLNQLSDQTIAWWQVLQRQFFSPFTIILLVVTLISFFLGEVIDGAMVMLFLFINVSLSFFQEFRSERSIQVLKRYITTKTHVFRDGKEELIEGQFLVPGDLVMIEAGDIVPADLRLIEVTDLTIDESSLTGESVSVEKVSTQLEVHDVFGAKNIAFSGTHVVTGRAKGIVVATGLDSEIGSIATLTDHAKRVSGFEQSIAAYSRVILRIIFFTLLIVLGLNLMLKHGQVDPFSLLFFTIALAISVIPEGLPVVTTLALSQGAVALAQKKVVVKRLSAIEDLGSVEILCTDKTGTLTQNALVVSETFLLESDTQALLFSAAMSSSFLGEEKKEPNNSFDIAIWNALSSPEQEKTRQAEINLVVPFDPMRKRSTVVYQQGSVTQMVVRGVPELILEGAQLSDSEKKRASDWASEQGHLGRRVLAVASKQLPKHSGSFHHDEDLKEIRFIGMIAFEDPLKQSAIPAVEQAKKLGIQVKILTGDSKEVSSYVAKEIGLISSDDEVMKGDDLLKLSLHEQMHAVVHHQVFSRVTPEQKHLIIHLLEREKSVGFLGEGINDAPALKSAYVGIVVNGASDIATQAADVVLLDNDLAVIVDGIRKGRQVFSNTVKYIKVTLSSNFGNFFAVAVASLLSPNLPMLPLQILLLNLLSDFPMIAIATDNVSPDELAQPKKYQVYEVITLATLLGVVSSFFDFTFFALFSRGEPSYLQTYWFIGSVLTELAIIYSIRVHGFFLKGVAPGKILGVLSLFAAVACCLLPFSVLGQNVFGFIRPNLSSLFVLISVVVVYFITSETVKLAYYSFTKAGKKMV